MPFFLLLHFTYKRTHTDLTPKFLDIQVGFFINAAKERDIITSSERQKELLETIAITVARETINEIVDLFAKNLCRYLLSLSQLTATELDTTIFKAVSGITKEQEFREAESTGYMNLIVGCLADARESTRHKFVTHEETGNTANTQNNSPRKNQQSDPNRLKSSKYTVFPVYATQRKVYGKRPNAVPLIDNSRAANRSISVSNVLKSSDISARGGVNMEALIACEHKYWDNLVFRASRLGPVVLPVSAYGKPCVLRAFCRPHARSSLVMTD